MYISSSICIISAIFLRAYMYKYMYVYIHYIPPLTTPQYSMHNTHAVYFTLPNNNG